MERIHGVGVIPVYLGFCYESHILDILLVKEDRADGRDEECFYSFSLFMEFFLSVRFKRKP